MDASEIRQMVKYKQAIAVISNAPPIRLTYPKYARLEDPPVPEREIGFRDARAQQQTQAGAPYNSQEDSVQSLPFISQTPGDGESRWAQASLVVKQRGITDRETNQSGFIGLIEPEYDPAMVGENHSPIFDDLLAVILER